MAHFMTTSSSYLILLALGGIGLMGLYLIILLITVLTRRVVKAHGRLGWFGFSLESDDSPPNG
jgi:hypothetical protein